MALARITLVRSLRRHPRDLAWLAVWSMVEALPALVSGWAVAEAVAGFLAGRTLTGLGWLGLFALAALAGAAATRQAYLRLGALVEPLRDELVEMIVAGALRRSVRADQSPDTDAVARLTHQAEIVRDAFAGLLTVACTLVFTIGSVLTGLLTLVPATLPYVIPPLATALLILRALLPAYAARQRSSVLGEERVASSAASALRGLRDVTACGAEEQVLAQIDEQVAAQADAARSVARIGAVRSLSMGIGVWLPLLLVLAAAPSLLRRGVTPAQIIGAVTYIGWSLRSAVYTLGQGAAGSVVRLTVTLERIVEASGAHPQAPGDSAPDGLASDGHPAGGRVAGPLEFHHVVFGYGRRAEPIIDDLSLVIPSGDHLAIVGPSGIGKSTLAGLLAGMLAPSAGDVLLGGVSTTQLFAASPAQWRVLIPQEAYVFSGTVAENLSYLTAEFDEAEAVAAARAVGALPLLGRLGGMPGVVNPATLSAGERQLIALARAYLSPGRIAILDEATSQLDPGAEARAESAFARRPGTLIVIAHRMSSALRARRVLVLDGVRAQIGDHASLLASSAMYRDLVGYWQATSSIPAERPLAMNDRDRGRPAHASDKR
jgi:ATP-binding cassette subfamily C protein